MTDWPYYIHWVWFIPTIFVSFALGILAMALCVAAKRAESKSMVYRLGRPDWPEEHGPPPSGGSVLP